jgi:hypothetical protein
MVSGIREKPLKCVFSILILLVGFASVYPEPSQRTEQTQQIPTAPPTIDDFYVTGTNSTGNVTWAGFPGMFSFNVSDAVALNYSILWTNNTGSGVNSTNTLSGAGPSWDNYTLTFNSTACILAFNYTVWNANHTICTTTGLRTMELYAYNSSAYAWNTPFQNLGAAISAVEATENWGQVETYARVVLGQAPESSLETVIDSLALNCAAAGSVLGGGSQPDWLNILEMCAVTQKLNLTWTNQANDIIWALENASSWMVGSLPQTTNDQQHNPCFCVENAYALYGYYYAAVYNSSTQNINLLGIWNSSAAYNQFDTDVNYSVANAGTSGVKGLPLWCYFTTGQSSTNRYYDEDACTIDCYLIFYSLLNVSDALNKAAYWWSYTNQIHWNELQQHYGYTGTTGYECEASFFLKIISILDYYSSDLGNWSRVLTDIDNRFLSSEWNSPQWGGSYVVIHENPGNSQRRLQNTLGTWQALLGVYLQLNSTYQSDIEDMLSGNTNTQPAWALLLVPDSTTFPAYTGSTGAGLFNATDDLFDMNSADGGYGVVPLNYNATALGVELMVMLGIVPGTTTMAFPLEELNYEYVQDIDPALLQLNSTLREVCIPVVQNGTITFQYGTSPITYSFDRAGVYTVSFSPSWNTITNVTLKSSLPGNLIYFYLPLPAHDVCVSNVMFSDENPSVNDTVSIYVTVQNKGDFAEEFSVSVNCTQINETIVGTQNVTLESGQTVTLNFTWTPAAGGLYVVKAYTSEIPGDATPEDNTQTAYLYVGTILGGGGCGKTPYTD